LFLAWNNIISMEQYFYVICCSFGGGLNIKYFVGVWAQHVYLKRARKLANGGSLLVGDGAGVRDEETERAVEGAR
jgi:hypothetical protein